MSISFKLSEDQELMQETARKIATEKLWPRLRTTEKDRALPKEVVAEIHELGLTVLGVPERANGAGVGLLSTCVVEEQLAWGDGSTAYALPGPGALAAFVVELGSEEQQKQFLSPYTTADGAQRRGAVAWSEAKPSEHGGVTTVAVKDGADFVINGTKAFVVNAGIADRYVVVAQVDESAGPRGLGAFVVDAKTPGVSPSSRRRTLGLDAAHVADVTFHGVRVSGSARLGNGDISEGLARAFGRISLLNAARSVGVATRAWELARDYCTERKAFGKPIAHFQAVAFTVADRLIDIESARWLIWQAAAAWDRANAPNWSQLAAAAATANEVVVRTGDDAVQLFGGAGFIRDYPVEKCLRDARQLTLMAPSTASLDSILADLELGRAFDPATFLPTSDIQPIFV